MEINLDALFFGKPLDTFFSLSSPIPIGSKMIQYLLIGKDLNCLITYHVLGDKKL